MKPFDLELWRPIAGFENLYEISSFGRVKSKSRTTPHGRHWKERYLSTKGRSTAGYLVVNLYKDGRPNMRQVHRLVAEAFIENLGGLREVNHKDGDRGNPVVSNLEWVTSSENKIHSYRILGRIHPMQGRTGSDNPGSKPVKGTHIGTLETLTYPSITDASKHGFTRAGVYMACTGKITQHKGYRWEYA